MTSSSLRDSSSILARIVGRLSILRSRCINLHSASCICLLIGLGVTVASNQWVLAQDPFGDSTSTADANDSAFSTTTPAVRSGASGAENTYLKTDPLIRRIREYPPRTPSEMAKAITWMVQLRSWENVGSLLDDLASKNWPVTARAETARAIHPNDWSLLNRFSAKLNEAQNKTLKALYSSPAAYARDPAVIDSLIDQLASDDRSTMQLAQLRLQDGQQLALKRLVDRLLEGDRNVPAARLANAILSFDRDGIDALRAACCSPDATCRSRSTIAVSEVPGNHFTTELASAAYSTKLTSEVRGKIVENLQKNFSRFPDLKATADYMARTYESALKDYQLERTKTNPLTTSIWQPTADGKVASSQVTRELATLERLTQIANLRSELESATGAALFDSIAIQLQRAYQFNPKLNDTDVQKFLLSPLPEDLLADSAIWTEVFGRASKLEMHGGAVRALQLLTGQIRAGRTQAPLEFLSRQLSDKRPVIRYLALEAIATADPRSDFAGSVQALSTAVEMTQLSQGPEVLVVGANLELCMSADAVIQQYTNAASEIAHSGRAAFLALSKQNPIEMIVVVDRVHDIRLYELLQRLRNSGSLPIAVLVDELTASESDLVRKLPGMHGSKLSRDPEHMKLVVEKMVGALDVKPMSVEDRNRFAALSGEFITRISADRTNYAFYPITDWHQQLVSTRKSLPPSAQAKVLSGLGTKQSQVQLTWMAAANGASEQDRLAAARSFEKSVKQFGVQLNDQDIKSTYTTYNQLGPSDPAVAKSLGHVLDVIEAQAGSRQWPEPL